MSEFDDIFKLFDDVFGTATAPRSARPPEPPKPTLEERMVKRTDALLQRVWKLEARVNQLERRRWWKPWTWGAAALALCCALPAQLPDAAPEQLTSVRVINATPFARHDIVTTVVPFARGTYRGEPLTSDTDAGAQSRRLGAAWPDGSWRHAVVHLPVRLAAGAARSVPVFRGTAARPPFRWTDAVIRGAVGLRLALRVGDTVQSWDSWTPVADGHLVKAWRSVVRVPGAPVWGELVLEVGSGLDHARWWLHYGDSDPRDSDVEHWLPAISLEVAGAVPVVHHAATKVLGHDTEGAVLRLQLTRPGRWADGESQALRGRLLFPGGDPETAAAESMLPVLAVAETWPSSGAFGPWGVVPPGAAVTETIAVARALADLRAIPQGDPWAEARLGCAKVPGRPGDQPDFSSAVLTMAASGLPHRLHAVQWSVYQEACRPTHYRSAAGELLRTSQIPDVLLWNCRNDTRNGISRDPLGKEGNSAQAFGHGHDGHDVAHWSINYLATFGLLTGDRWALREIDHKAEAWLSTFRVASGNPVLDGMGTARTVGRSLQAGTLLYLLTGRPDLERRLRARVRRTAEQWVGRDTSPVRPLGLFTDPRVLGGVTAWRGWMEAMGVRGLDAVDQVLDDATARVLAWEAGRSTARYGVWQEAGRWTVSDGVRWLDGGVPSSHRAGGGIMAWTVPGLAIVEAAARWRGDDDLAGRCRAVLEQERSGDWRALEWGAVR